jgi:hypothetical protein
MDLKRIQWYVVDWSHLDQETDKLRALVNTAMNLRLHKMRETSWVTEKVLLFQE